MKRVLVVDDEEDMLWMLQRNLNKGMQDVEILAANSGEEALNILSDKSVDLVITDINMPGMSGLDLLIEIKNRFPGTGVIIMTAYPSSVYENQAMLSGSLRFIEKPFDIKEVRSIVKEALKTNEGFQGTVDGIDLLDIVQLNGLSRATAALKVTTRNQEGIIFFREGAVVHAMCGDKTGEEAFFTIIKFNGGSLQNIRGAQPPSITIYKELEALLFEVAVENDEGKALEDLEEDLADFIAENNLSDALATSQVPELYRIPQSAQPISSPPSATSRSQRIEPPLNGAKQFDNTVRSRQEEHTGGIIESTELQKILNEFKNIEGVHTACLVGRNGVLLDNLSHPGIDTAMVGTIASAGFGSAESMGTQLGQGDLQMTMFEFTNGPVIFAPVGDDAFLVIVADQEANLGWIRISLKRNAKKIKDAALL